MGETEQLTAADAVTLVVGLAQVAIPAILGLIAGAVSGICVLWMKTKELRQQFDLETQKLTHEFELQRDRLRTELKLEFATEAAIRELLSDKRFSKRSLKAIERRLGGLEGHELRKALLRAGAVSFRRRGVAGEEGELWGLRERNMEDLWEEAVDDEA
jgi:hypothetical protein